MLVLLAAACGGEEPRIPRDLAEQLSGLSEAAAEQLESGKACAGQAEMKSLQAAVIEAVNSGRVPGELQEELLGQVNALLDITSCPPIEGEGNAVEDARALSAWLRENAG